jgi:FkbM family methyltransferase
MRLIQLILKYNPKIVSIILRNIEPSYLRGYLNHDFLSPIQNFIKDGYSNLLYSNLNLDSNSRVLILGAYLGDSVEVLRRNSEVIHAVEPVPEFASYLKSRFKGTNVVVHQIAVTNTDGLLKMRVDGEKSSINISLGKEIQVTSRNISKFISELGLNIDLCEINIEGSEYSVLQDLIDSGKILKIKTVLVQFHKTEFNDEFAKEYIRNQLSKTHLNIFCYPWVWERWDLIMPKIKATHAHLNDINDDLN